MDKTNKLSLTKKLNGGYLHVKKSPNNKVRKGGYADYLKKNNGNVVVDKKNTNSDKKIVTVQIGKKKSPKKISSKKNKKPQVKDIPNIVPKKKNSIKDISKVDPKVDPKKNNQVKNIPNIVPKKLNMNNSQKGGVNIFHPKVKGSLKKHKVLKKSNSKSKHRILNKSLTKRRNHDLKKGKRISITKTRKYSEKDISKIQTKLKDIKKKSTDEIKKELEKQGVKLSGKSPEIIKDIYMYSQLCGINIKRE